MSKGQQVWLAGQSRNDDGTVWELQGVFDTEGEAVDACTSARHFVAPATIGEQFPEETQDMPGCYYPNVQERPQ